MDARELLTALLAALVIPCADAMPCAADDFETRVTGVSRCLVMRRYGPTEPAAIVVWLHGDAPLGAKIGYLYPLVEKTAANFLAANVMSVALLRPDFADATGASSTVDPHHGGRRDIYTRENILEVGGAIQKLRLKYRPKTVIIVGQSGGAATAAVLLGMMPQLAEAAVLVGCPCELVSWRRFTGDRDDVTPPELARDYVDLLRSRGIDATFQLIPGATHGSGQPTGALHSTEVVDAIARLLPR